MNFDEFCTIVPLMRAWLHGVLGHGLIRAACDQGEKKGVERFQVRMGKSYLSTQQYTTICNNMQQFHTTFLQDVSVDSYCFLFNWMFIISSSHTIRRRFGHQTSHMPKHWTTWTSHCMILHASTCIPIDWI